MTRALALLAVLGVLTGCGSAPASSPAQALPVVRTPAAPLPCSAARGLPLPAGWPRSVPLPADLLVTRTERRAGDRLIAYGRVAGDFHGVVAFFNTRLPAAGLTQRNGQLDPFDAESDFSGAAVQGRWTTSLSAACPDRADVTVLVLPAG